jgi:hypothetical protein
MMRAFYLFPFVAILLTACSTDSTLPSSRIERLSQEISQFRNNPEIVAFLAEEAARAGVRSIRPVPSGGIPLNGNRVLIQYGLTTDKKIIYINAASAGGRSIVNLTHEIAHAARFGGKCGGHNSRWLNAYLEIAARFEERFPGYRWSGTTPTDRVMRNKTRYDIGGRC